MNVPHLKFVSSRLFYNEAEKHSTYFLWDNCQPAFQVGFECKHPYLLSVSAELTHQLCGLEKM